MRLDLCQDCSLVSRPEEVQMLSKVVNYFHNLLFAAIYLQDMNNPCSSDNSGRVQFSISVELPIF